MFNLFPPFLLPPGFGWDPLNIQITTGWVGFYATFMWDAHSKIARVGLGVVSLRVAWL